MRTTQTPIDPGLLAHLYVDERLSIVAIAAKFGRSDNTILRRLRRAGIEIRPRGPVPKRRGDSDGIAWSPATAYAVGLMATDGNLSRRKGYLSLVSKDVDLIETFRQCLHVEAQIAKIRSVASIHHKVQWCDRGLYDWLIRVGLTPAKSHTIGPLAIPDALFVDFFRGCINGDGSVVVYTDTYHASRRPQYVYERLYVSLVSASLRFLEWAQASVNRIAGVAGAVRRSGPTDRPLWVLRYAKAESIEILAWMYYAPDVPCLARKRATVAKFFAPLGRAPKRSVGRPRVGWLYTDTAKNI